MKTMEIYEYDKRSNIGVAITIPEISCRILATPIDHVIAHIVHGEKKIEVNPYFDDYDNIVPDLNNEDDDMEDYIPRGIEDVLMDTDYFYNRIVNTSDSVIEYDKYIEESYGSEYLKYKPITVDISYHKYHVFKYSHLFTYKFEDIIFETDDKRIYIPKNIINSEYLGGMNDSIAVMHSPKMCKKPGNRTENIWICNNIFPVPAIETKYMDKNMIKKHKEHWDDLDKKFGHIKFKIMEEE